MSHRFASQSSARGAARAPRPGAAGRPSPLGTPRPGAEGRPSPLGAALLAALLALALAALPRRAAAEGCVDLLRAHVDGGTAAAQVARHDEAAARLGAAYLLEPVPTLLFNLAQVRRKAGRGDEAAALFQRFLAVAPQDPLRAEAEALLAALPPPSVSAAALLQQQVDAGAEAAQDGRPGEAADRFAAAFALSSAPALLFNSAQLRRKAGDLAEARCLYQRFLAAAPGDPLRAEAEGNLAAVAQEEERREAARRAEAARRVEALRRDTAPVRAAARRPGLRPAGLALLGVGLAAAALGGALLGVDGRQSCPKAELGHCELELDSRGAGIALLSAGAAALGVGGVLLGVSFRREARDGQVAQLLLGGVF